jgi:outer membrane receptor for ferrienterochelin and colicins
MKNTIILFFLLISPVVTYSGTLEGYIHSEDGEALPGVNITIIGTVLGTSSNIKGEYRLSDLVAGSYSIRFTMMGFRQVVKKDVSVPAQGSVKIDITLKETIIAAPEILISANKRRQNIQDSPNSVGIITQKDFKEKNEIYLDNLLEHASGVNFMRSQINIRGSSGFSYGAGSRILFLVDGVPVMPGDSGDIKWDLIPASQIDHVEIIKGAGSAVYGSNALGGVINVITKEASAKPVTNLRLSAGFYDKPAYPEWQWTDRILHFDDIDIDHTRKLNNRSEIFLALGKHQSTGYRQNNFYQRYNASMKYHTRLGQQSNFVEKSTLCP